MNGIKRRALLGALALLAGAATSASALAQASSYPNKPIRIIVPFAVGGIADTFGRVIGIKLTEAWGQPVIIENKAGAGGNIGAELVAKSAADGYTLVMGNNGTHAVNVNLFKSIAFDPVKDFIPIAHVLEAEGLLVVNPSIKANSVSEIVEMARAQPGKLSYVRRARHHQSSCGRVVQVHRQGGYRSRALQRQLAGDRRFVERPNAVVICHDAHRAAAREGRQAASDRIDRPRANSGVAGCAHGRGIGLARI